MNAAQLARATVVIERADLLCATHLVSDCPLYLANPLRPIARGFVCCGLGELALDAGHTFEDLLAAMTAGGFDNYTGRLPLLVAVYGLTEEQCDFITAANDEPIEALGEIDAAEFALEGFADVEGESVRLYDLPRARKAAVLQRLASFVEVEVAA